MPGHEAGAAEQNSPGLHRPGDALARWGVKVGDVRDLQRGGGGCVDHGDTDRVLDTANIRTVFGVDADVLQVSGRRVVVPRA